MGRPFSFQLIVRRGSPKSSVGECLAALAAVQTDRDPSTAVLLR